MNLIKTVSNGSSFTPILMLCFSPISVQQIWDGFQLAPWPKTMMMKSLKMRKPLLILYKIKILLKLKNAFGENQIWSRKKTQMVCF